MRNKILITAFYPHQTHLHFHRHLRQLFLKVMDRLLRSFSNRIGQVKPFFPKSLRLAGSTRSPEGTNRPISASIHSSAPPKDRGNAQ